MNHILIIGGSVAGISAALRVKEVDPQLEVTVVVAGQYPNFSICGLPLNYHTIFAINSKRNRDNRELLLRTPIRNYGDVIFHHRGHREHREKNKNQFSVNSVFPVV